LRPLRHFLECARLVDGQVEGLSLPGAGTGMNSRTAVSLRCSSPTPADLVRPEVVANITETLQRYSFPGLLHQRRARCAPYRFTRKVAHLGPVFGILAWQVISPTRLRAAAQGAQADTFSGWGFPTEGGWTVRGAVCLCAPAQCNAFDLPPQSVRQIQSLRRPQMRDPKLSTRQTAVGDRVAQALRTLGPFLRTLAGPVGRSEGATAYFTPAGPGAQTLRRPG
jgi:hypothetical protein